MKLAIANRISEEDYLAGERVSAVKHEYVAGEVFAMAGASKMPSPSRSTLPRRCACICAASLAGRICPT